MLIPIKNDDSETIGLTKAKPGLKVTSSYNQSQCGCISRVFHNTNTLEVEGFDYPVVITPLPIQQLVYCKISDAINGGWPYLDNDIIYKNDNLTFPYAGRLRRIITPVPGGSFHID